MPMPIAPGQPEAEVPTSSSSRARDSTLPLPRHWFSTSDLSNELPFSAPSPPFVTSSATPFPDPPPSPPFIPSTDRELERETAPRRRRSLWESTTYREPSAAAESPTASAAPVRPVRPRRNTLLRRSDTFDESVSRSLRSRASEILSRNLDGMQNMDSEQTSRDDRPSPRRTLYDPDREAPRYRSRGWGMCFADSLTLS